MNYFHQMFHSIICRICNLSSKRPLEISILSRIVSLNMKKYIFTPGRANICSRFAHNAPEAGRRSRPNMTSPICAVSEFHYKERTRWKERLVHYPGFGEWRTPWVTSRDWYWSSVQALERGSRREERERLSFLRTRRLNDVMHGDGTYSCRAIISLARFIEEHAYL